MKQPAIFFSAIAVAFLWLGGCADSNNTAQEQDATAESSETTDNGDWKVLFDGTSLEAWRNYRADTISDKWQIVDGELVLADEGAGDIVTRDQYSSFELEMDWKISMAGNSGMFFHVVEADSLPTVYYSGPEIQILDDERHPDGELPSHRAGANYDMQACSEVAVKPVGEWNHMRVVVDQGHVQHFLNGVKVVDYVQGSPEWQEQLANSKFADWPMYAKAETGHIALQDHGNKVWFRNIRIREL